MPANKGQHHPLLDKTKINCKRCQGSGKRLVPFFIEYPEEYQGDVPSYEMMTCDVCDGSGEVDLGATPPRL